MTPLDPTRLDAAILDCIGDRQPTAGEIAEALGVPESLVAERLEALDEVGRWRIGDTPWRWMRIPEGM